MYDDTERDEQVAGDSATGTAVALAAAALLAGCGGGGGGETAAAPAPAPAPPLVAAPPVVVMPTSTEASRFLGQATNGATKATIANVTALGYDKWLNEQFAMPRAVTHWDWLVANGYSAATYINSTSGYDPSVWRQAIVEPDQLRQRVGLALLDILVVGVNAINLNWKALAAAAYYDLLLGNAFGNYRTILGAITTNAAMASFLTFLNNRRANGASLPDENYARELMQLFTLGLYQLNMDGSVKTTGGVPVETYGPADVSGLARVFTGLTLASTVNTTPDRHREPLVINAGLNETGSATFLGTTVAGGGITAVDRALDVIFAHANVAPFVSKQLIQRLVTSNPTPAYVGRVAAVFADNGAGVRGDMKAVIRAILLDTEARGDAALTGNATGKLRAPVLRITGWARAFNVNSPSNAWTFADTGSQSNRIGQSIGRSPTVFNYFRPGYAPPATAIAAAKLVAPEFQVTNEQSVVAYVNYMGALVRSGTGDTVADYADAMTKAADTPALVDEVNLVLAAGQLSATTIASIRAAVDSVPMGTSNWQQNRVSIAALLTLASPDYLVVR